VIKFVSDLEQVGGFLLHGTPVSTTNKTDRHDITEILLRVALNTSTPLFVLESASSTFIIESNFIILRNNVGGERSYLFKFM
jgi:type VI protein secretion system component Hcp